MTDLLDLRRVVFPRSIDNSSPLLSVLHQFSRHVARFFLWGEGAFGERSESTRPKQLRSERSEQAVAGVWGRSPQRGPGAEPLAGARGAQPPGKISRNRVF